MAALALLMPSVASAWPQAGGDDGATYRATADGPRQPGLKWLTMLEDVTDGEGNGHVVDEQIVGASHSRSNEPLTTDETVVVRARTDAPDASGIYRYLGLDAAGGSYAWHVDDVVAACHPAIDASGRLWGLLDPAAHDGMDERTLRAYDAGTGDPIDDSLLELPGLTRANWCSDSAIRVDGDLVVLTGGDEVVAIDVSGTPEIRWSVGPDEGGYEEMLGDVLGDGLATLNDDSVLVPVVDGDDALELLVLARADGTVTDRVDLPRYDSEGEVSTDNLWRLGEVSLLADGDHVVAGIEGGSGGRWGAVHGIDLGDGNDTPAWTTKIPPYHSTAGPGPSRLALSGSHVIHDFGHAEEELHDTLGVRDLVTGQPASWDGEHAVRESGSGVTFDAVTDVSDRIYTATVLPEETGLPAEQRRAFTAFGSNGNELWTFTQSAVAAAAGVDLDEHASIHLGGIGDDGTLYLQREGLIAAIDDSGGLAGQRYGDLDEDHPFFEEIDWATFEEITTGYADGTWRPGLDVSRQAVAAFLYRLAGEPTVTTTEPFPDVPTSHPFHDPIAWMTDEGITTGFDDDTFRPGADVTRQAAAAFLHRIDGGSDGDASNEFSDVPAAHTFHDEISWAVSEDITTGYPDGTFRPSVPVTRQAIAAFVHRFATG